MPLNKCLLLSAVLLVLTGCAGGNRPLQLLSGAGPVYPEQARADGVEGSVTVVYDVGVDGSVSNARVLSSTPSGVFDAAALAAVSSWRFNPPRVDGEVVPAMNRQSTVDFRVSGGDAYDQY